MTKRATTIWILIVIEALTALCVFCFATTRAWQKGVHGRNDDFRGSYWRVVTSIPHLHGFYRAVRSPNVTEYWGKFWPEHLIAAVGVWLAWRVRFRNHVRGGTIVPNLPCAKCGYNLIGQVMAGIKRCPECGGPLPRHASDAASQRQPER